MKPLKGETKKRQTSLWLDPDVLEALRQEARLHELSLSESANLLLRKAVVTRELEATSELVHKRLENLVRRTVLETQERVIYLCAQAALESGTLRQVFFNWLREAHKDGGRRAADWNAEGRKLFLGRMRERPEELLRSLVELGQGSAPDGERR